MLWKEQYNGINRAEGLRSVSYVLCTLTSSTIASHLSSWGQMKRLTDRSGEMGSLFHIVPLWDSSIATVRMLPLSCFMTDWWHTPMGPLWMACSSYSAAGKPPFPGWRRPPVLLLPSKIGPSISTLTRPRHSLHITSGFCLFSCTVQDQAYRPDTRLFGSKTDGH